MASGAGTFRHWGAALLSAAFLAACDLAVPVEPTLKPQVRPVAVKAPPPVVAQPTSQASAELRSYLNQVQSAQLTQGLLRRDGGGVDTPFTADRLASTFEKVALFNEYDGAFTGRGGISPLRRWVAPVRMQIVFGASVPPSVRQSDTAKVTNYATRLARVTGHPVSIRGKSNFFVVFSSEDDREEALDLVAQKHPNISRDSLNAFRNMGQETYCGVVVYPSAVDPNNYDAAVAVIRAENPDLLRLSCIHEELAQGMGLANDSPDARPSIFNDDDEFALLTTHDELLLKMLYDPRLKTGMNAAEAAPLTRIIARELTGGPL